MNVASWLFIYLFLVKNGLIWNAEVARRYILAPFTEDVADYRKFSVYATLISHAPGI